MKFRMTIYIFLTVILMKIGIILLSIVFSRRMSFVLKKGNVAKVLDLYIDLTSAKNNDKLN